MARQIRLRQGTTSEHNIFTGALGEITYDTNKKVVVTHDGVTVGGHPNAARANADGTISLIKKDGGLFDTLTPSTDLVGYAPIAWAQPTPPSGYIAMMGQGISQAIYPKLYSIYGRRLPDMRGLFIRGLDGGRGYDSEPHRGVLSEQGDAIRNITGEVQAVSETFKASGVGTGAFLKTALTPNGASTPKDTDSTQAGTLSFDASRVVPVANENRPKNIAFLYIVKAG